MIEDESILFSYGSHLARTAGVFLTESQRYIDSGRHLEKLRKRLWGDERGGEIFFSLPSLSPASMLNPSTSPLKSVIDSPQLSGSINVQDGGIALFPPPAPPPPKKNGSRCEIRLLYRLVVINILFILMAFSLNYLLKMLGENRC